MCNRMMGNYKLFSKKIVLSLSLSFSLSLFFFSSSLDFLLQICLIFCNFFFLYVCHQLYEFLYGTARILARHLTCRTCLAVHPWVLECPFVHPSVPNLRSLLTSWRLVVLVSRGLGGAPAWDPQGSRFSHSFALFRSPFLLFTSPVIRFSSHN